jgi:hypothetical protein
MKFMMAASSISFDDKRERAISETSSQQFVDDYKTKNSLDSSGRMSSAGGLGNIVISKIVKKKGNFGIFFKRLLTLTDDPRLAYTNDGGKIYKKFIDLGSDTKIVKLNQTTFKINYPDLNPAPLSSGNIVYVGGKKPELQITFRCENAKECDDWVLKIS